MKLALLSALCLSLPLSLPPTAARTPQDGGELPSPWLIKARTITDDIVKDGESLAAADRALLLARLAEVWWKHDERRARGWLRRAVEEIESATLTETQAERRQKSATARRLVSIVAPLDAKLLDRVSKVLVAAADPATGAVPRLDAEALLAAASALLKTDSQRAFDLGRAALRTGQASGFTMLLWGLRARAPKLADALFDEVLASAQAARDRDKFGSLVEAAYPRINNPQHDGPFFSDATQRRLLAALAATFMRGPASQGGDAADCSFATLVAPVSTEIARLLPERATVVRAELSKCLSASGSPHDEEWQREQPLESVEEMLEAAGKASDARKRAYYHMRAAITAAQSKEWDRAISILEGMGERERAEVSDAWRGLRMQFAVDSALAHFRSEDYPGMRRVLAETPAPSKASVKLLVTRALLSDDSAAEARRALALELLGETRKEVEKAELTTGERAGMYLELLRMYADDAPADALAVFRETVKAWNEVNRGRAYGKTPPDAGIEGEWLASLTPIELPAALMEIDYAGTREAVASLDFPPLRAKARLGLLQAALGKIERPTAEPKKAAANSQ